MIQFAYAALTARILTPSDFAIYAIAVIVANLVAVFSVAGLGQAVARLDVLDASLLRSLSTVSFVVGLAAMLIVAAPASLWALLWNSPSSGPAIALAGVTALFAPAVGLLSGYMRRVGKFRILSIVQLGSSLAAFGVSFVMVLVWRSSLSLVASAVMLQIFCWIALAIICRRNILPGRVRWKETAPHLSFSWRVTAANLMSFALENVPKLLVSRFSGPVQLGYWNRADVIATVPFDRLNAAVAQVLYPEYRHDAGNPSRVGRRWPDMLALVAWLTVPLACFVAGAAPVLVPLLLGPAWVEAVPFVTALALASALRGISLQLASALEAIARFKWIWAAQGVLLAALVPVGILTSVTGNIWIAIGYCVVFPAARHAFQLIMCVRAGFFPLGLVLRAYLQPGLIGMFAFATARMAAETTGALPLVMRVITEGLLALAAVCAIWLLRRRLGIWALLSTYGFGKN